MFIAINRFKVIKGQEQAFEQRWLGRDGSLDQLPGFIEFHLLRGPERDDHTLYASHTSWASKQAFTAWTQSEQFRAAHRNREKIRRCISAIPNSRDSRRSKP